jgi:putative ABC transport system permease protein
MKVFGLLESIWQDACYALRTMRKNPGFTTTAVLMVALAIGGNTAMFTVIHAVLLKPLDYHDADRLVRLSGGATPTRFAEMESSAHSFTALGAFTSAEDIEIAERGEPEVLRGVHISATFLRILEVHPLLGRGFLAQEDSAGGAPVAMISAGLWQRRFGADPRVVGKRITLGEAAYTVIGVLPPHFQFPFPGLDVWMTAPSEWPLMAPKSRALSPFLSVFGRLKPGVSLEQTNSEMKVIRHQYSVAHPSMLDAKPKTPLEVTPMKDDLVRDVRSMLWLLFGAVGLVLLIACGNVASLLLARATFRSREFAVRSALGAARGRLFGQLLVESLLLSFAGGALGVLLAVWAVRAIPHITAFALPRATEVHLDFAVLGFAALLCVATGVLFGLAPSLSASRPDLIRVLRTSGESANESSTRTLGGVNARSVLSVGQIALSIVLLIGAALLMESVARLRGVDVGFNPANLLTARISLPPVRYDSGQKTTAFFSELIRRVRALPGVREAAASMSLPMTGYAGTPVQDAGKPVVRLNQRPLAKFLPVTPGYFNTLEIPLRRGREFTEHDTADAERVAIIDEHLARHFWPDYPEGLDPVGQRLLIGGVNPKPAKIVGIVANVHQALEGSAWPDSVYVPFAQSSEPFAILAVRTAGYPLSFTRAVRAQVQALDPDQALADVKTMNELVEAQVGQRRLLVILLGSFASVALLLALIGIYGVISYSVAQRTQEMAIRRALGAQQSNILWLVIRQGLLLTVTGVSLGIVAAVGLTRVMKSLLFHVSATDPTTFVAIALAFVVVALAASYIPARRGAGVDPMEALRV